MKDDLGAEFDGPAPRRVVSLVPSITESVARQAPELLVGATDYCTHPAELDVPRVGGSKYPRVERILDRRPDLVLANAEENRKSDVEELRAAGVPVWVCLPRTVPEACDSAERMMAALRAPVPDWTAAARLAWGQPAPATRRAVIPIWRKPWMALGPGTFATDVLRRLGVVNVLNDADSPYPRFDVDEVLSRGLDLVVLPDEPYAFGPDDGPEAFAPVPAALISGRHLTWHGPSLAEAHEVLSAALDVSG